MSELIGKITGSHGVRGDVVFEHKMDGSIDTSGWDALMIELLPGSRIPFFIEKIKLQSVTSYLVKFEEINSPEEAKDILQLDVYLSPNVKRESIEVKTSSDSYIGFALFDNETKVGIIDNILNPNANPLFIINEDKENELLIPANKELIVKVDFDNKKLITDLPEGLY